MKSIVDIFEVIKCYIEKIKTVMKYHSSDTAA